ncbi:hypothetical protein Peur_039308 [Populus x canadensis]
MGISIHPPDNMCSRRALLQSCQNKHLTPGIKSDSPVKYRCRLFQPMTSISFLFFNPIKARATIPCQPVMRERADFC